MSVQWMSIPIIMGFREKVSLQLDKKILENMMKVRHTHWQRVRRKKEKIFFFFFFKLKTAYEVGL